VRHPLAAWRRLPVAVRFFVGHASVGLVLGTLLTAALLWADPGGVGTLLRRAEGHPGPLLLLWFFLSLSLGAVQTGVAVMLLGYPEPERPPRDGGLPADAVPARARAQVGSRRTR
jgi:hypothetical protein